MDSENVIQEQVAAESAENVETPVETEQTAEVSGSDVDAPAVAESDGEPEDTAVSEVVVDDKPEVESAMLTNYDLRRRIQEAYLAQYNKWGWIGFWFPANSEAWMEDESRDSELEYTRIVYTVGDDDTVTIQETQAVTLTVAVSEINTALATRDDAIVKANERINELSAQIAALQPYKDAADKAEQERIEAETAEKRKAFREKMVSSKLFDEDELETSEVLKNMIECLDENALKAEIAERFMAKLDKPAEPVVDVAQAAQPAVQETRTQVGDGKPGCQEFMRVFLGKH